MTKGQQKIIDFLSDGKVHSGREFYANYLPKFATRISEINESGDYKIDIQLTGTKYRNYKMEV